MADPPPTETLQCGILNRVVVGPYGLFRASPARQLSLSLSLNGCFIIARGEGIGDSVGEGQPTKGRSAVLEGNLTVRKTTIVIRGMSFGTAQHIL